MDALSSVTSSIAAATSGNNDIQVAVLKKAMDSQSQAALALISAIPQPPSVNLPAHLGSNVNTSA
jgi:hypothetical protein